MSLGVQRVGIACLPVKVKWISLHCEGAVYESTVHYLKVNNFVDLGHKQEKMYWVIDPSDIVKKT